MTNLAQNHVKVTTSEHTVLAPVNETTKTTLNKTCNKSLHKQPVGLVSL